MFYYVTDAHNHRIMLGKSEGEVTLGFFTFYSKEDAKQYRDKLSGIKCSISGLVRPFKVSKDEGVVMPDSDLNEQGINALRHMLAIRSMLNEGYWPVTVEIAKRTWEEATKYEREEIIKAFYGAHL